MYSRAHSVVSRPGFIDDDGTGYGDGTTTTPDTVFSSVMNHVTIIKPTKGVFVTGRPPIMNHVTVLNSSTNGITFDGFMRGDFILNNCSVLASTERGIYFRSNVLLTNARLQINACTVENSGQAGIYVESNVNITIIGSSIRKNAKSGCTFRGRGSSSTYISGLIVLRGNKISENQMHGLRSQGAAKMSIKNNTFSRNLIGTNYVYSTLHFDQCGNVDLDIQNNILVDNTNYYTYYGYITAFTVYLGRGIYFKLQVSQNSKSKDWWWVALALTFSFHDKCIKKSIINNAIISIYTVSK